MTELENLSKVSPGIPQIILLDEICGRLEELSEVLTEKLGALEAYIKYMGPMTRVFKRDQQYQYRTVLAGGSATVYRLENPQEDLLVGIITQVANDWYPHTFLEWFIDYEPKRIEYVVGSVDAPKEFLRGIPFHHEVKWVAHNEDVSDHVFGVLCDGFFVDKELYRKIVGG